MFDQKSARNLAEKFTYEVQRAGVSVRGAYLFGSYAKGNYNEFSDVDVAVISDDFVGFGYEDRKRLNPIILKLSSSIEVHPFRSEDFALDLPFVKEIVSSGIKLV